jgi:hypothetical protein
MCLKIVEAVHATHDSGERPRDGERPGIGEVYLSVHLITMNFGVESRGHSRDTSAERNPVPATRHVVDHQSLGAQPGSDFARVRWTETEAVGELLGRKPAMKIGGARVLLVRLQAVEIRLLCH